MKASHIKSYEVQLKQQSVRESIAIKEAYEKQKSEISINALKFHIRHWEKKSKVNLKQVEERNNSLVGSVVIERK